jgi:hypothetical protein
MGSYADMTPETWTAQLKNPYGCKEVLQKKKNIDMN